MYLLDWTPLNPVKEHIYDSICCVVCNASKEEQRLGVCENGAVMWRTWTENGGHNTRQEKIAM